MIHTKDDPTARDEDGALLLQGEISDALRSETGLHQAIANEWAAKITNYLRTRLGTQRLYIPAPSQADRDAAIVRDFNGTNAGEVCARYNVSRTRMYEICARRKSSSSNPVSCLKTGQLPG